MSSSYRRQSGRGRTVLVSGAGRGIGLATCRALKAAGFEVVAGVRTEADMRRMVEDEGVRAVVFDVRSTGSVAVGALLSAGSQGTIFAVVSNAAVPQFGVAEAESSATFADLLDVNLVGAHRLAVSTLPLLRAHRALTAERPRLVFVSSVLGFLPSRTQALYCASKGGLEMFADSLREELYCHGIDVITVQPGATSTDMWGELERGLQPALESVDAHIEDVTARQLYKNTLTNYRRVAVEAASHAMVTPEVVAARIVEALTAAESDVCTHYQIGKGKFFRLLANITPSSVMRRLFDAM